MKELEEMSEDEELRRLAELKEKAIRDEKSAKYRWTEEGIKQGLEQGIKQGIEQGIQQGIEQGKKQEKIEIVKKLLELNTTIEDIIKVTNLTREEILKIKNK